MTDIAPILSGFIGTLFGAGIGLVGVYMTQRATEKRSEREFSRDMFRKRLEKQEQAATDFRRAYTDADAGKLTFFDLEDPLSSIRIAFGEYIAAHATTLLLRAIAERRNPDAVTDSMAEEGAKQNLALLDAMRAMTEETLNAVGLAPVNGEKLHVKAMERQNKMFAEAKRHHIPTAPSATDG